MKTESKEQILNSAVKLIQEGKEPADITVRDIAAEANVQLGLINYHFRTKDELMYQAVGVLRYKLASNIFTKDKDKSAYIRFREMLIEICDMSVKYSQYMRFTVEYELTKAEIVVPQYIIPLIREIYATSSGAASSGGNKISETSIRIKAYEIISILQLIFFRAKDISNYLGFDVLDYDRMVEIIDTILNDHFPNH